MKLPERLGEGESREGQGRLLFGTQIMERWDFSQAGDPWWKEHAWLERLEVVDMMSLIYLFVNGSEG